MKIIRTHEDRPANLSAMEAEWTYNGLDCCLTSEILDALLPQLDNHTAATYNFSRELQGPALEMRLRGILVDQSRKAEVIDEYFDKIEHLNRNLERIVLEGVGLPHFNWRSNADLHALFYDRLRIPVIRRGGKPTVNREALEKMEAYLIARPIVRHISAMRDLGKKIGMLKTEIDPDGRMRTSYNIAGTDTGRFSSSFSEFGTGCVRPTAEALTRNGWKQVRHIGDDEEIAQWDRGEITFVPCKMHVESFNGNLVEYQTEQSRIALTPQHRVLFWDYYNKTPRVEPAIRASHMRQIYIPLGGSIQGDLSYPQYLPMLMADFSLEGNTWRGAFKKQRKIERLLELAETYNLNCVEQVAPEGYRRFAIKGLGTLPKKWGPWVLNLTSDCAKELIEEARYWDSHDRGSGYVLFTADQEQAEWFATLAHLAERSATIRRMEQSAGSYSETVMWWVNVKAKDYAQVLNKHWHEVPYTGNVFCPQVPSSFWLVREEGCISVTGNTNLQNVEESLRSIFISDPGMKMAKFDAKSGESYVVGAIEWNLFNDDRYLEACESGDPHTASARLCWPDLGWTGDLRSDKNIAERIWYRHYTYRFMCKKLGHGSNYGGKANTLSQQARVPVSIVTDFQSKYFTAFPAHLQWQAWVDGQIRRIGQLISLTGRKRQFWGRRNEDSTLRAAIAFDPQCSLAEIVNNGMLNIFRARDATLYMHDHDALSVQYPEALEDEIIPKILKQLEHPVELKNNRTLLIPYDCKTGWNRADWSENNPDGLKDYKPSDERRRPEKVHLLDRRFRKAYG